MNELLCDREISIGDYVLSGGELAAAVIVDAVVRLLPGALGNPDSSRFESFGAEDVAETDVSADGPPRSTYGAGGFLDYPHYTRPADFMGVTIPEALAGGNHEAIRRWRRQDGAEEDAARTGQTCWRRSRSARRTGRFLRSSGGRMIRIDKATDIAVFDAISAQKREISCTLKVESNIGKLCHVYSSDYAEAGRQVRADRFTRRSPPATPFACKSRFVKARKSVCRPLRAW